MRSIRVSVPVRSFSILIAGLVLCVSASVVQATPLVIDDFDGPAGPYAIPITGPSPVLIKSIEADVLAAERDLLVTVVGSTGLISATGQIFGGTYLFGSVSPGAIARLQYDGVDADIVGPPADLVNALGLGGVDLTGGGSNAAFRLDFASVEGGLAALTNIAIAVTSAGGSATYSGSIPDSAGPVTHLVPFSAFTTAGSFSFAAATSIELVLNSTAAPDVDLELSLFSVDVPEPTTLTILTLSGLGFFVRSRRRG